MANFLDLTTGLPALWAKIKSKFYTKAEVDALIPEDEVMIVNITEDNGTYRVNITEDNGTYSSNKTYAEMASFIRNGGKTIIAQYRSEKYPLVYLDDNGGESDIYGEIDFGYISFSPHYEETPTEIYENVLFSTGFYIDKDNNIEFSWEPIVAAPDSNPLMDGVAAIGTSNQYARADHVHPTDTSRIAVNQGTANAGKVLTVGSNGNVTAAAIPNEVMIVNISWDDVNNKYVADKTTQEIVEFVNNGGVAAVNNYGSTLLCNNVISDVNENYYYAGFYYATVEDIEGSTSVYGSGVTIKYENGIESVNITQGNNFIPSPASDSDGLPIMDGTASRGDSINYARADHVHPSDTSRAAVADVLTKTNTTSYTPTADYHPATKKYVDDAVASAAPTCATTAEIEEMCDALGFISVTIDTSDYEERSGNV